MLCTISQHLQGSFAGHIQHHRHTVVELVEAGVLLVLQRAVVVRSLGGRHSAWQAARGCQAADAPTDCDNFSADLSHR